MKNLRRIYDLLSDREKADFLRWQQKILRRSLQKRNKRIAVARAKQELNIDENK